MIQVSQYRPFTNGKQISAIAPKQSIGGFLIMAEMCPQESFRTKKATSNEMALYLHVIRWQRWAAAGLQDITIDAYEQTRYQ